MPHVRIRDREGSKHGARHLAVARAKLPDPGTLRGTSKVPVLLRLSAGAVRCWSSEDSEAGRLERGGNSGAPRGGIRFWAV